MLIAKRRGYYMVSEGLILALRNSQGLHNWKKAESAFLAGGEASARAQTGNVPDESREQGVDGLPKNVYHTKLVEAAKKG